MIYTPREDSFLLKKEVIKYAKGKKVLDMGSGSGIQAETALNAGAKSVLCADINLDVIKYLKNKGLNAIQSDLFEKIRDKFDLIIFNPPYLPKDEREDDESAEATTGGKRGDEIIIKFLKNVKKYLAKNGMALIVVSSLATTRKIFAVLKNQSLSKEIIAEEKFFMENIKIWKILIKKQKAKP